MNQAIKSKEKKHNYFYKITNILNGKFYYGIHSTDNLNDGYLGSGGSIKKAIKKYGKENFIKEIIADYPTRKEASDHEKMVVTCELIRLKECYNCRTGGENEYGFSEEILEKLRKSRLGKKSSESSKKKVSEALKGERNPNFGKTRSKVTRERIGDAMRGDKNHNFGKVTPEETKQKISVSLTNRFGGPQGEATKKKLRYNSDCKPCQILGIVYHSMSEAARQLGMNNNTVSKRLRSNDIRFCDWIYLKT